MTSRDPLDPVRQAVGTASDMAMQLHRARRVAANKATFDEAVALVRDLAPVFDALARAAWPDHSFALVPVYRTERTK